ncbi:MAG TPA: 23S rRNA (uracil(1939)-C(5))-methyltransferase RlmD [Edaphobacter sp.]|nr:23S rRNA (uracil(1939)-C(5))-methyltransferase RlmD [Edaphobacter sp.]
MKLAIEKVVYGGSGLAHLDEGEAKGEAVFVPFTLPGEIVKASTLETRGGFSEAAVEEIVEPSPNRTMPHCAHFGACGGCQYQHAFYDAQLQLKQDILQETLERAGLNSLPAIQRHHGQPWGYRNRIRLRVSAPEGVPQVGYLRRASTEFLPVQMCPIAAPILWRTAEAFLELNVGFSAWIHATEEIEVFTTGDEQKLQVTLFVRTHPAKGFNEFCEALHERVPELAGVGAQIMETSARGRKSVRLRPGPAWGVPGLSYIAVKESYWVSRSSFFQVNRFLVERLIELTTAGRSGKLAWDLYAGVGLFSRVLAKTFAEVVAVEVAGGDLETNFRGMGRRAVTSTTVEFLRQAALERDRPSLIVMDPPRAGVGAEVCALLARVKAPEIVYVSCDPVTLGRDLRAMVDSGYRLNQLHLVDMFPQTFHQETVAVLVR